MRTGELSDANILIAEDNPTNYALLEAMIDIYGARHVWAKNGLEVLDILETNNNISVILMDINMPQMDGITATKKIREKDIQIPVIFQTAYDNEENKRECFIAGGNDFISKPISKEKLFTILKKYFQGKQSIGS
jgi:CheY-like chemotaxis protein